MIIHDWRQLPVIAEKNSMGHAKTSPKGMEKKKKTHHFLPPCFYFLIISYRGIFFSVLIPIVWYWISSEHRQGFVFKAVANKDRVKWICVTI